MTRETLGGLIGLYRQGALSGAGKAALIEGLMAEVERLRGERPAEYAGLQMEKEVDRERARVAEMEAEVERLSAEKRNLTVNLTREHNCQRARADRAEAERDQAQEQLDKFAPLAGENEIRALKAEARAEAAEAERDRLAAVIGTVHGWIDDCCVGGIEKLGEILERAALADSEEEIDG